MLFHKEQFIKQKNRPPCVEQYSIPRTQNYSTPLLPPPKLYLQNSTPFFLLPTVRDQLNVSYPLPHGLSQHGIALYETIGITR